MQVILRALASIRPYENNPRLNDAAVDAVAASIRAFGFLQPIVVDEEGVILAGHTRYKAALKLGLETAPVLVAAGLACPYRKCHCGRLAHTPATSVLAHCQRRKLGALSKRYHNTIVTRSIGLALNGSSCVDPAGRRGFRYPQAEQCVFASLSLFRYSATSTVAAMTIGAVLSGPLTNSIFSIFSLRSGAIVR
jgi:ParB-like nuclease domain